MTPSLSKASSLILQRKCACSGSTGTSGECPACHEKTWTDQRAPAPGATAGPEATSVLGAAAPTVAPATSLIVEDESTEVGPGQMRKSDFLDALGEVLCSAADAELAAAGRTAVGCPYIAQWLSYYRVRDAQHLTRAISRYAPETAGLVASKDLLPALS